MASQTYSPAQISNYLSRISFPHSQQLPLPTTLNTLSLLQLHHLSAIPFENLALHYSPTKTISVHPEDVFEKIVGAEGNGRGGYCMEVNVLFGGILRGLGFEVYAVGGRVYADGRGVGEEGLEEGFGGWAHQVNIVVIDEISYLVDVGFGSQTPNRPLPLNSSQISPWGSTSAQNRLLERPHPKAPSLFPPRWILQYRISDDGEWTSLYTFSMVEFTVKDFEVLNFGTSCRKTSFFTYEVMVTKMVLDRDDIVGVMILEANTVKRRVQGETEVLRVCKSEEERVDALERWFGIRLGKREKEGIKGTVAAIK